VTVKRGEVAEIVIAIRIDCESGGDTDTDLDWGGS